LAASKREENTISVGIGIGIAVAIAIGCMGLQKPTATATATPIPIPMIATLNEHDLRQEPHFLIKCPPVNELISKPIALALSGRPIFKSPLRGVDGITS